MFVCLHLFIFIGELPLVENRHKLCVDHPFFLSLSLQFHANAMSYVRGKGGKMLGEGRGAGVDGDGVCLRQGGKGVGGGRGVSVQGAVGGSRDDIVYPARDIRTTGRGGKGRDKSIGRVGPGQEGSLHVQIAKIIAADLPESWSGSPSRWAG